MGCFGAKGQKLSCSETRGLGCGTPFPPPSTLLVDYWPWGVPDVTSQAFPGKGASFSQGQALGEEGSKSY